MNLERKPVTSSSFYFLAQKQKKMINIINEYKRAKIFLSDERMAHISLINGFFYNGIIIKVTEEFFIIKDLEKGEVIIFFEELNKSIESYTVRRKD